MAWRRATSTVSSLQLLSRPDQSTMRLPVLSASVWTALLLVNSAIADSWTFSDGKATVAKKGDAVGTSHKFSITEPLAEPLSVGPKDTLKLTLNIKEGEKAARPHQAFLLVMDPATKLETFFTMSVKESGKAKVEVSHRDISPHLLAVPELTLSIVLGSFDETAPTFTELGTLVPVLDGPAQAANERLRQKELEGIVKYGPKPEIRHVFKPEPKSPPKIITLVFTLAVLGGLGGLFVVWFPIVGANLSHAPRALKAAPLAHTTFCASLIALEGIFFMYYISWNLFETLGAAAAVGVVTFFSGIRALREVRARRVSGVR